MIDILQFLMTCGYCSKQFVVAHRKLIIKPDGKRVIKIDCPQCKRKIEVEV